MPESVHTVWGHLKVKSSQNTKSPYINNRQPSRKPIAECAPEASRGEDVERRKLDVELGLLTAWGLASDPVVGAPMGRARGRSLWLSFSQPRAASSHSHRLHTQACTERTPSLENSVPFRPSHKTVLRGVRNRMKPPLSEALFGTVTPKIDPTA